MSDIVDQAAMLELPPAFDVEIYRRLNPDLVNLSDPELVQHYARYGEDEGRVCNSLLQRGDFAQLIPQAVDALEIGPFWNPLLRGPNVRYFDVLAQPELEARAATLGIAEPAVPAIDYVSPHGDLAIVDRRFDCVLSSHAIEHQPDLIRHLNDVSKILRPGGCYYVLVPDKRYCFDHFISPSSIAEVLEAHNQRRTRHSLKSIIEHRALTTHNDCLRHWHGDHGPYLHDFTRRVQVAMDEFERSPEAYIDVHAWTFTPKTAADIIRALQEITLIDFELERVYPTRIGANEFWFILRKRT